MIAGIFIFLYLLLITPLQLGAVIGREDVFPRGAAGIMIWGIPYTVHFIGRRDASGKFYLKTSPPGKRPDREKPFSPPSPGLLHFFRFLHASAAAWHMLKKGVRIKSGSLFIALGGENAALLACLTGILQAVFALSRRFSLHVYPLFQGKSRFRFRCIVETRLGTLLAAGLLGAFHALKAGKKEEASWIIPSET